MHGIHIIYFKNSKSNIVCHVEHSLGLQFWHLSNYYRLTRGLNLTLLEKIDLIQTEATSEANVTIYSRLMSTFDWVFPKQTSTTSNSYKDQQAERERERKKESNKEWGENVCMCIRQWFPSAPLGANGEETLQTFITEQHAELTTSMAAPVSATSICSSLLVEMHCQMASNCHSNQSVPTFRL